MGRRLCLQKGVLWWRMALMEPVYPSKVLCLQKGVLWWRMALMEPVYPSKVSLSICRVLVRSCARSNLVRQ